jgi:drug/metabolite transporter (DMT)-like permease
VLALAAVVLISLPGGGDAPSTTASTSRMDAGLAASARGRPSASELLLILVAGLGFAGFFLGLDAAHAVGGATWWPILVVRVAGIVVVAVAAAVLLARRRLPGLRAPRRVWPLFVVAGSGDLGGNLFFLAARGAGSLPVAVVVSSLYPVVTALLARFLVGERLTQPQLVGVAAAVVGVMLIAAGGV